MLQRAETIYRKANELVKCCGTRDTLRIACEIGIYIHHIDDFKELLGMYSYQHKERHILLNANMDYITTQMVCGHEIGHDALHREQAKVGMGLQEFTLLICGTRWSMRPMPFQPIYGSTTRNCLSLWARGMMWYSFSSIIGTNINLMLIKLNELNRMGCQLNLPYIPRSDFLKNIAV